MIQTGQNMVQQGQQLIQQGDFRQGMQLISQGASLEQQGAQMLQQAEGGQGMDPCAAQGLCGNNNGQSSDPFSQMGQMLKSAESAIEQGMSLLGGGGGSLLGGGGGIAGIAGVVAALI
jgi:hypothetical protein